MFIIHLVHLADYGEGSCTFAGIVEESFTLARVKIPRHALQLVSTDTGALVLHVVAVVTPLAWQMGRIEVVSEVAPNLPAALVDAQRLEQALQNIWHNAVHHTHPGGMIPVVVEAEKELLSIRVCDTGEGIAPEKLSRIWERFYQGNQHTQKSGPDRAGLWSRNGLRLWAGAWRRKA